MALRRRVYSDNKIHFVTFSVYKHIDVFNDRRIAQEFGANLNFYLISRDNYKIYAYVIMPSHVHLLVEIKDGDSISDLVRDIKKYFSYKIKNLLPALNSSIKDAFIYKGKYQFWARGFDEVTINSERVFKIKLQYIINNPVKAGLVNRAEEYPFLYVNEFETMEV